MADCNLTGSNWTCKQLWAAVVARYEENILIGLTNPRKRGANAVDDDRGEQAAQDVIDYFPLVVQLPFDSSNPQHVQIAILGVLAMLWRQGGTAANAERIKWEDWEAQAERLKMIEPRAHASPNTNSTLTPSGDLGPYPRRPWADRRIFRGLLPNPTTGHGPYGGPDEWQ